MSLQQHVISLGGHPLAVSVTSGGLTPVLLLHGWTATAAINWGSTLAALGGRYRLLAYDHRGHGRGVPRGPEPVGIPTLADDAVRVLDELGVERAILVGYSMGGAVAQQVLRTHPARVQGLVLAATATYFVAPGLTRNLAGGALGLGAGRVRGLKAEQKAAITRALAEERLADAPLAGTNALETAGHDLTVLVELGAALVNFDSRGWWPAAPVPTSVIATTSDNVVPFARQLETLRYLGGARLHPVVGGHSVCLEQPATFQSALVEALSSVGAR